MRDRSPGLGPRPVFLAAAAIILLFVIGPLRAQTDPDEVRAIWILRTTLSSQSSIETMVDAAKGAGFNTLFVEVPRRVDSAGPVASVRAARRLGAGGVILFSYDGLTGPSRGTEYLAKLGRAAFMQ